ncbi:acyl-CoA thioesterase [Candidatus Manganitrophus noduliformans]|uniref:Acyl-CoA thioesterase n=1 Tax=Candidatus Manganitrophus noduliformans TaxID=2606439 RepID=A0A7X6IAZ6_9BACT|nr:thioesterase family protein [Candidatus Manganitrophus noduliformans]NKE70915.1 acyl-CoA thioesterase [Candidatus Manganitrophus noduliformans]
MSTHLKTILKIKEIPNKKIGNKFIFRRRVYLSDTNAQGNVYFAKYFEWQGDAREEFFRTAVPIHESFFSAGYRLLTVEASLEYKGEAKLYDEVEITITVGWIRRASAELKFIFSNAETGSTIAVGKQIIASAEKDGKPVAAPQAVRDLLLPYCESPKNP